MTFAVGTRVRTKQRRSGHTRLPAYLQRQRGVVTAVLGAFALPDSVVANTPRKETLYTVTFDAPEVFSSTTASTVCADLFESYLEEDR